jgi:monoterpene epsilon-lactone hydrolase
MLIDLFRKQGANMPSPQSRLLQSILKYAMPGGKQKMTIQERRARTNAQAERFIHPPRNVKVEKLSIGNLPAEWMIPEKLETNRTILYLHGGAYTFCSPATHRGLTGHLALACQARVLVIDYRLAPENPFPAALEDALAAWHWLVALGSHPSHIVIAGDSAGGGLTLATALSLRDAKKTMPAGLVVLSPWVDVAASGEYARPYSADHDPKDPLISPIYADLSKLPPTLIQAGGADFILNDAIRLDEKMAAAGVDVSFKTWKGMTHVFQAFTPWVPEANQAIKEIGDFCLERL